MTPSEIGTYSATSRIRSGQLTAHCQSCTMATPVARNGTTTTTSTAAFRANSASFVGSKRKKARGRAAHTLHCKNLEMCNVVTHDDMSGVRARTQNTKDAPALWEDRAGARTVLGAESRAEDGVDATGLAAGA